MFPETSISTVRLHDVASLEDNNLNTTINYFLYSFLAEVQHFHSASIAYVTDLGRGVYVVSRRDKFADWCIIRHSVN
jgi:hypothetical protein